MKGKATLRLRSLAVGFRTALLFVLATSCHSGPPADAVVVREFEANAQHFDRLRAMLTRDSNVGAIGKDFLLAADKPFEPANLTQVGLTERRPADYRRLLAAVGAERLDRDGDSSVSFVLWGSGFAGNTHHKGIAWLTGGPPATGIQRRFLVIRDNWCLYQD
jgi:hypothetical protein